MVVCARESKTATSIGPFSHPHNVLRLSFSFLDIWIATMRTAFSFCSTRVIWRNSSKDRSYTFHGLAKTHMVIPFVLDLKWFYTGSDGVNGQFLKIGGPVWVD